MRELLLVRKLQEEKENAKKNKLENSNTSTKDQHDTADSSTNNNTTDNTNQTFNREFQVESIKSRDVDDNIIPDDKINPTHQIDTPNVDKISEQDRSEHTSSISDQSMGETSFNEKTENSQTLQTIEENAPVDLEHDGIDLTLEEKKNNEAVSLALQTKRESLKEFFLHKQPYVHKDTFTDNQIVLDSNFIDDKKSTSSIKDEFKKEELMTIKSNVVQDTTSTDKLPASSPANSELSPDEKRQKAAANRNMHRKNLRDLMRAKKLEQKSDGAADIIIMAPDKVEKSLETKDNIKSEENSTLNDDKTDEANSSIHLKRSKNKTLSEDSDSDGSVDLDALIAEGSDLESGEIQLNDDGFDDGDDSFWKVDPTELKRHLTPSTSPLPRHSPDPQNIPTLSSLGNITRAVSMIAEEDENLSDTPLEVDGQEADDIMDSFSNSNGFDMVSKEAEYEDDEINEIDMSLDTQITPILKPITPSPVPSPYPTLSGGKLGIPAGLSKTAFSAFVPSPLSPTSSRASSVGDPDDYETMSNGSYTSVRSTGSAKSGASGIRRPSTVTGLRSPSRVGSQIGSPSRIATPGRVDSHSSTPTPQRSRSLSVVSDSSTEESTTSSVGATSPSRIASPTRGLHMSVYNMAQSMTGVTRPRSLSRVSNSSADDVLARTSTSHIAPPKVRSLSRAGSHVATPKSSNISTGSQSRVRNSVPPSSSNTNSTKSKYADLSKRSSSRADVAKPSSTTTTSVRSLSRLGSLSESSKTSAVKKTRPQSIAVGNTSTNNAAKTAQPNNNTTTNSRTNSGIRSPSNVLRASHYGGRQSTDSLSSHDEHSASSMIFTPPESPTAASETDSLTSLTSSVSYGSSPGRGPSPIPSIPSHNTSMLATPTRLSKPGTRTSMTAVSSVSKTSSRMIPSKLATPSGQPASGLRKPKVTKE